MKTTIKRTTKTKMEDLICIKELKMDIVAMNKTLRKAVHKMSPIILLNNVHPLYRLQHAIKLKAESLITKDELKWYKSEKDIAFDYMKE